MTPDHPDWRVPPVTKADFDELRPPRQRKASLMSRIESLRQRARKSDCEETRLCAHLASIVRLRYDFSHYAGEGFTANNYPILRRIFRTFEREETHLLVKLDILRRQQRTLREQESELTRRLLGGVPTC
jgi:hypothetical protein